MDELYNFLKKSTTHLKDVTYRKSYGVNAIYVSDQAFLLITKEERIAMRIESKVFLSESKLAQNLEQCYLNDKKLEHWYLIPVGHNKKKNKLIPLIDAGYSSMFDKRKNKPKKSKPRKDNSIANIQKNKQAVPLEKASFFQKVMSWF